MKKATNTLEAKELVEKLTLEAVNLFYLNGNPDDPEVGRLESTIELAAEAWDLPREVIEKSKETISAEREATRSEMRGEQAQGVVQQEELLQSYGGKEIMTVIWVLFETAVRLGAQEKREQVLQSAQFLAEYLGLEEWISESNRPTAKRTA
jgi:hypothetical protein